MAYQDVILADGPTAYWRLNETSGTTAVDSAGPYDGSYGAGMVLADDVLFDSTPRFPDTAGGQIIVGGSAGLVAAVSDDTFTVEVWVKDDGGSGANARIFQWGADGLGPGQLLLAKNSSGMVWGHGDGGFARLIVSDVDLTGSYHHIVATYDGTTHELWANCTSVGSEATNVDNTLGSSDDLWIGNKVGGGINGIDLWSGWMGEFAIYPYVLSQAQIEAHCGFSQAPYLDGVWD